MSRVFEALHRATDLGKRNGSPWDMLLDPAQATASETTESTESSTTTTDEAGTLVFQPAPEDRIVAWDNDHSAAAENIRILAGRLNYVQQRHLFKTLLITSSTKNEGKTVLTANLGITLAARDSKRVLLIDGDSRQASLSRIFDVASRPGLTDCLETGRPAVQFLQRVNTVPLWLLPIGRRIDTPLRVEDLTQLLSGVSDSFDWIIIDSAPVTLLANAAAWSVAAERYLLVVRRGVTPKKLFSKALESINEKKLLGVVMNDCNDQIHAHYARYYQRGPAHNESSS